MSSEGLLESLRAAVEVAPNDAALRLHLAEMLWASGLWQEAIQHAAAVLQREPDNRDAMRILTSADADSVKGTREEGSLQPKPESDESVLRGLDRQLSDIAPPMFVADADALEEGAFEVEMTELRLADVGGMEDVKARLEAAVLVPLRRSCR